MKNNMIKMTLVLAFIAGCITLNPQKTDEVTELMKANVEALADATPITPKLCPGGLHLCQWIISPEGSVTYYDQNGPDTI